MTTAVEPLPRAAVRRRRLRRGTIFGLLLAGLALAAGIALGLRIAAAPASTASPLIGRPLPSEQLPLLAGGSVDPLTLRGRPLVLTFWASWCDPCRQEAQVLAAAVKATDITVLGVVYQDDELSARTFLEALGRPFPGAMDPGSRAAIDLGVIAIPETVVVDANGTVRAVVNGELTQARLDQALAAAR